MDRPLRIYLWFAFGITWGFGGLALLARAYQPGAASAASRALHYVAAFGHSLAGLVMAGRVEGRAGLRRLLARALPTWSGLPWYVAVIIGFPLANLLAARLLAPEFLAGLHSWDRLLYRLPLTLVVDTGPLGEEFGWRGFALPLSPALAPPHRGPNPRCDLVGVAPADVLHLDAVTEPALDPHLPGQ